MLDRSRPWPFAPDVISSSRMPHAIVKRMLFSVRANLVTLLRVISLNRGQEDWAVPGIANRTQSWKNPRRVLAKVEWHPGEVYPLSASSSLIWRDRRKALSRFLQSARHRGAMDQGGKGAIKWTRPSCRAFAANAVRLQLHALVT
jgi:hypothetical protein